MLILVVLLVFVFIPSISFFVIGVKIYNKVHLNIVEPNKYYTDIVKLIILFTFTYFIAKLVFYWQVIFNTPYYLNWVDSLAALFTRASCTPTEDVAQYLNFFGLYLILDLYYVLTIIKVLFPKTHKLRKEWKGWIIGIIWCIMFFIDVTVWKPKFSITDKILRTLINTPH